MASYLEYQLEDGSTIYIATDEPQQAGGVVKASRDKAGNVFTSATVKFEEAFAGVKKSALVLRRQLEDMRADEVEVMFGLKAIDTPMNSHTLAKSPAGSQQESSNIIIPTLSAQIPRSGAPTAECISRIYDRKDTPQET